MLQFLKSESLALYELKTAQIRLVFRASLAVHTYTLKNGGIRELFSHTFRGWGFLVTLLSGVRFLRCVLGSSQAKFHLPYKIILQTPFEAQLYLNMMSLMSREVERKKLSIFQSTITSPMNSMEAQLVRNVWNAITQSCLLWSLRVKIRPFL